MSEGLSSLEVLNRIRDQEERIPTAHWLWSTISRDRQTSRNKTWHNRWKRRPSLDSTSHCTRLAVLGEDRNGTTPPLAWCHLEAASWLSRCNISLPRDSLRQFMCVLPPAWVNLSQILGPLPSASQPPSVWYAEVDVPHMKSSGNDPLKNSSRPSAMTVRLIRTSEQNATAVIILPYRVTLPKPPTYRLITRELIYTFQRNLLWSNFYENPGLLP